MLRKFGLLFFLSFSGCFSLVQFQSPFIFIYGISVGYLFGNKIGIAPEFNILWTAGEKLSHPSLALALGLTVKLMGF
jgi:hypothetical protein